MSDGSDAWRTVSGSSLGPQFRRMGNFRALDQKVIGGEISIALSPGKLPVTKTELLDWIGEAAEAVTNYYGKFPVKRLLLVVLLDEGDGVNSGNERGGARISIKLGSNASRVTLKDDWQLTHEFFHLGFPDVPDRYHWMEEGLATYLEPLGRARVGHLKPERVWKDMVEGLPQGLPQAGDEGLDNTPTWGRTYWGGALFWLLADIEIRERTADRRSLDDAIRGIWSHGGDGSNGWSLEQVLREGDRATGVPVLEALHQRLGEKPVDVDLQALWKRLGVIYRDHRVTFDNEAPLASVRKAMTDIPALTMVGRRSSKPVAQ